MKHHWNIAATATAAAVILTSLLWSQPIHQMDFHRTDTEYKSTILEKFDKDGDGSLSAEERRKAHKEMSNMHPSHGSHEHGHAETKSTIALEIGNGRFPTVGFEETHEVTVSFPVEDVRPLFEPDGRHLIYKWWNPATVLRDALGETLKGLVTVSEAHGHEIFLVVTQHEPERGHIQYLVLWDDFELQRIDITCVEGKEKGSTKVIWQERNAGIHENGVRLVSRFVEGGNLKSVVQRYAKRAEEYLRNRTK